MTIDHKQLALTALEKSSESIFGEINDREVARAQVHATLAVAEQARIANLLTALNGFVATGEQASLVYEAISEGLGI